MDFQSLFYVLGTVFFITFFVFITVFILFLLSVYWKISKFKQELPMKFISYLQKSNSSQLKAFAIAIVGYLISFFRGQVTKKSKTKE